MADPREAPAAGASGTDRLVADLVEAGAAGIVAVDDEDRCLYANAAARRMLAARPPGDLALLAEDESLHVTRWRFTSGGHSCTAMSLQESGRVERQLRRVAAFARTASRIACRAPLQGVLDGVALEARTATGAVACSIILLEPGTFRLRMVGTAGHAEDYVDRLVQAVELGAPLASIEAFRTGRPAFRDRLREMTHRDPRYEPLWAPSEAGGWEYVVAAPAVVQGQCVGVLTSFFQADGRPTDDDVAFLLALADQTAAAVDNANLVTELQAAAAAAERHDLAIELHDAVSQALFSVIMQSRALAMRMGRSGPGSDPAVLTALAQLESTVEEMQREMRGLLRQMQTDDGSPRDLGEELRAVVRQVQRGIAPRLVLELPDGGGPDLDPVTRRELIRVVREAVANSVRHARATTITISATTTATELAVAVVDDGAGFDPSRPAPGGHLGLKSMSHRTARIGGTLQIESLAPGTAVRVRLPVGPPGDPR